MSKIGTFAIALALSCTALSGALGVGCSSGSESGTTGKRVSLKTTVVGEAKAKAPFTNALGWTITLSKAYLSMGALYYFDGDPIFSLRAPSLRELLSPKRAYAHPGHYVEGNAKGEMTTAASVDLLAVSNTLGVGNGTSGAVRSARFSFSSPPAAPFASQLGAHVVHVEGEAKNGSLTLQFIANADLADVLDTYNEAKVEGCVFAEADVQADGTVTLTVLPTVWFDQVDFTDVKASTDGSPADIAGTIAFNGFTRGLKKATAYVFTYSTP